MTYLRGFMFGLVLLLCVSLTRAQSEPGISEANLTFTTIDVPGAAVTNVYGINSAGEMVGNYSAAINAPSRGFRFADGSFTLLDYPGGSATFTLGINDSGLISGWAYVNHSTAADGFLYDGTSFTTIRTPGKSATFAKGINNAGVIVGGNGTLGATEGFALIGTRFKNISPPGDYIYVFGDGINNLGRIIGTADDTGFLYYRGKFKTLAVPGANMTQSWGINDSGVIVGWYSAGPCLCGFALMKGKYLKINFPGAIYTAALGINNAGQVVGSYTLDQQTYHGFVTNPITAADFR